MKTAPISGQHHRKTGGIGTFFYVCGTGFFSDTIKDYVFLEDIQFPVPSLKYVCGATSTLRTQRTNHCMCPE